jgi:hypothetical protein
MAFHARHVRTVPGEVRVQVMFQRTDLLYCHEDRLRDPHARRRDQAGQGHPPMIEVPGLPLVVRERFAVGPSVLDMLTRALWPFDKLPLETQLAVREQLAPDEVLRKAFIAWSVRDLDTLWPAPGQTQRRERTRLEYAPERERVLDHPFIASLASGGVPIPDAAPAGWLKVSRRSTCQIAEYVYRVACGVFGSVEDAYERIAETAAAAWEADQTRALQLWARVQQAPAKVLVEDASVAALRPNCSVSQEVERAIMQEVCRWLGVDPELDLKRPRGRPKSAEKNADQGEVIRLAIQADRTLEGVFLRDYRGIEKGTRLEDLTLHVLASVLGALRTSGLDLDARLLEAWLDAAMPDWRERLTDEDEQATSSGRHDPYDVLGVRPDAPMEEVTAAYRRAMKAVHPDVSGGASAWLSRAVIEAYRQIRAARAAGGAA